MNFTLERKIFVSLVASSLLLLSFAAVVWWNAARLIDTFRWVDHTQQTLGTLDATRANVLAMQLAARDFVLTGDERQLAAFQHAADDSRRLVAALTTMTADNPPQSERLATLTALIDEAQAAMQTRNDLRRTQGLAAAARATPSDENISRIQQTLDLAHAQERQLLGTRSARVVHTLEVTMASLVLGAAAAVGLLVCAGCIVRRDFRLRREAEESVERHRATLETLFEHAADGLIVVDADARIVRVNGTAGRLLGYNPGELARLSVEPILPGISAALAGPIHNGTSQPFAVDAQTVSRARRHDGSEFPIELTLSPVALDDARVVMITVRDITRREAAQRKISELNRDLQRQNRELESAVKELEAFSYSVSHDLRAPLRHIDGFANLLEKHAESGLDDTGRHYLETISRAAQRMGRLIDDLLAFSRTGRSALTIAPVSHDAIVADVIRELQSADAAPVEWQIGPLPMTSGDEAMLRQVWFNLLDNAVKYSAKTARPRVEIGATRDPAADRWVFHVRDNGVGFEMRHAPKLFGVFQRLHTAAEFPGTGIGLANVRRIVARHGGETWAEGVRDQGATFYFSLPLSPRPAPALSAVSDS